MSNSTQSRILACFISLWVIPMLTCGQQYSLDTLINFNTISVENITDLAVGTDGDLYIVDLDRAVVHHLDRTGTLLNSISGIASNQPFEEPNALAVTQHNKLYVTDTDLDKLFIVEGAQNGIATGKPGKNLGELNDLGLISINNQGYAYLISKKQQQIVVFSPEGEYLTWIKGYTRNFETLAALDFDNEDNLYVLEKSGPSVHIFDPYNTYLKSYTNLSSNPQVSIENAHDIEVLGNGDFFILDKSKSEITHFKADGTVMGKFGSQGRSAKGVFQRANAIAGIPGVDSKLFVLDKEGQTIQSFNIPEPNSKRERARSIKKIKLQHVNTDLKLFKSFLMQNQETMYLVYQNATDKVLKVDVPTKNILETFNVEEVQDLAIDHLQNLYVLDSDADEVIMYDSTGVLIRKFGQEIAQPLDDPTSLATLSDGSVLVVDRDNKNIKWWNNRGVFKKTLLTPASSPILEPRKVRTDRNDFIYVWDDEKNTIFKFDTTGQMTLNGMLYLRGSETDGEHGEIGDFDVDPLNQLHLFNVTNNQYEIYQWEQEPVSIFRYGRTGSGKHGFEKFQRFGLDSRNFISYIIHQKGDLITGLQFILEPPVPTGDYLFTVKNDKLNISLPPSDFPAVTHYGLARLTAENEIDTVIATSVEPSFTLPAQQIGENNQPDRYALFAGTHTAQSQLTSPFTDLFSYADAFYKKGMHKKALEYHYKAYEALGKPQNIGNYLSAKYSSLSRQLLNAMQTTNALYFNQEALRFSPTSDQLINVIADIYSTSLHRYAAEKNTSNNLVSRAATWRNDQYPAINKQIYSTLDTIAGDRLTTGNEQHIEQAKKIYDRLVLWDDKKVSYLFNMSRANFLLYKLKKGRGAPDFELNVYLNEAFSLSKEALNIESETEEVRHNLLLHHADILLEQNDAEPVVELISRPLARAETLSDSLEISYRERLASAYSLLLADYDAAVAEYQKILAIIPSNSSYKKLLAEALIQKGAYEDAKNLYEQMLFNDRDNPELIAKIGEIELLRGNFSEASFQLEKALQLDAGLLSAYPLIAQAYEGSSNFQKAIEYYTIALNQTNNRLERADTHKISRTAIDSLRSNKIKYTANMAHIYSQMGQYDDAIDKYKSWSELEPANSEAWHGLGTSYLAFGRVYDALKALNTALKLNPTSEQIDTDLARARQMRDEISKNRPPIEITEVFTNDIFPSLYKNYVDANQHPIGSIVITNNTNLPKQNARLTFFIKGLMDAPTEQSMKPLIGYSNTEINLSALFNDSILNNTSDQSYQAVLTLIYMHDGSEKKLTKTVPIKVLGRNRIQWSDKRRLAAFVNPDTDILLDYVKKLDVQFRNHPSYNLNTHILKAIQVYTTLHESNFVYSVDPETDYSIVSTNTNMLDFLQYPAETLKRRAGDCDDLVATMCSLLETSGIKTSYIDIPGHVFMAFDTGLKPGDIEQAGLQKEDVIIQYNRVWIPVETTLIGTAGFDKAWESAAQRYYKELEAGHFPELISLSDARQIYTPSSYVPKKYTPALPDSSSLQQTYTEVLARVYKQTAAQQIHQLEQRISKEPENIYVLNQLGIMYSRANQLQKADTVFQRALAVASDNPVLLNNAGNIKFKLNDLDAALQLYQLAASLAPEDGEILINITKVHVRQQNLTQAYKVFTKAITLNQQLAEKYRYLQDQINQ